MAVRRRTMTASALGVSAPPDRHPSRPSHYYWRLMDARRAPATAERRTELLQLIHRIAGATATTLYAGNTSPQFVDHVGELVVDVKHDDRARAALSTRRPVILAGGSRCELQGIIFTGGLWRPLDVQGLNIGLVRLLARTPRAFHPAAPTLLDFAAAWLAASLVTDGRAPVWVDPAIRAADLDEFDGDLDQIASLVVDADRARTPPPLAAPRRDVGGSGRAERLTLAG